MIGNWKETADSKLKEIFSDKQIQNQRCPAKQVGRRTSKLLHEHLDIVNRPGLFEVANFYNDIMNKLLPENMLYTWDITGGRINHYLSPIIPTDLRFEYPGTLSKALLGDSESMAQISMCAWIQILQTLEMILNEFWNNIGDSKMLFGVSGARGKHELSSILQ
ncbi:uncharacterized protein OCT59_022880 [Rhizophagus irregularis]|uniref:Uncharacterized protein n=2 Tax=Rhizophagus irregularis TaxID=588596 RepID=A0A915ZCN1_9GLOM|nr:hypothetical protein OCT59_022880 [Rhizophagus irregularis]CAB4495118.1 unnamed protein product [Rhizophagus irregularis]CAB5191027.1 unnamed protein product [Rhizophagus irregularis]CAB5369813.1 unnamed protein product [Rhizophagus irregularis]